MFVLAAERTWRLTLPY